MTRQPSRIVTAAVAALMLTGAGAATVLSGAVPVRAQAARDASAEAFVQREAQHALQILNDRALSLSARKAAFRSFVDQAADVPRVTSFVLGRYRRQLSPDQYAAFAEAFREYANSVYESRLGQYHGEGFRVTGSIVRAPGDVVVTSQVVGGRFNTPAVVDWRVINSGGGWKVVDVEVQGVWLAITQQQDFTSTLANNRGDINVLIGQLRSAARG